MHSPEGRTKRPRVRAGPPDRPRSRQSIIDPFEPILKELLVQYPNLTVERALQELQARGFTGNYTVVRQRLAQLRPRALRAPVPRFETGPTAHDVQPSAMWSTSAGPKLLSPEPAACIT